MTKSIEEVSIFFDGLDHPECIALHPDGTIWAGGEAGQIYRISSDGSSVTEVANTGGFVLGIAFSPDLSWLAICDLKKKCVWKLDLASFKLTIFADNAAGKKFATPNFPVFDLAGNLYISDSGNFRQVNGMIMKFDSSGTGKIWHEGPFNFTNGMALSADQRTLYVVCTFFHGVEKIMIDQNGNAGTREILISIPETCPDGIAIDVEGNLYLSCYAPNTIFKIDINGKLSTLIHDWESHTICNPTNIAFGGKDNKTLFIANLGRWHISTLEMDIAGLPLIPVNSK